MTLPAPPLHDVGTTLHLGAEDEGLEWGLEWYAGQGMQDDQQVCRNALQTWRGLTTTKTTCNHDHNLWPDDPQPCRFAITKPTCDCSDNLRADDLRLRLAIMTCDYDLRLWQWLVTIMITVIMTCDYDLQLRRLATIMITSSNEHHHRWHRSN